MLLRASFGYLGIILIVALFCTSCKESSVSNETIQPGSRNYEWKTDTIYAPYNLFGKISGTSPVDIWIVNDGDPERAFYHFDGLHWTTDSIRRTIIPTSIYSLSPTSVWCGGCEGKIWHYNGQNWTEKYRHSIMGYPTIIIEDIYAVSEIDIYAVGQYRNQSETERWGLILHFNGQIWEQLTITNVRTEFIKIRKDIDGTFYLWGITNEQYIESTFQFYSFNGQKITQIKSGTLANDQLGNILELGNRVYFIIGYDFFKYANGNFNRVGRLSDSPRFINAGIGRSEKDILIGFLDGIAHYNGDDTEYLIRFSEQVNITGFKIFEKDIFIVAADMRGNNLILHGILRK